MKRFWLAVVALFVFGSLACAFEPTWLSSHTATVDTTLNLCKGVNYVVNTATVTEGGHGIFHGACINQGAVSGILTVYNSSGTATLPIAAIATTTMTPCSFFDVSVSSGLTYTNTQPADVTMLYTCY